MSNTLKLGISVVIAALLLVVVYDHTNKVGGAPSSSDVQSTNYTEISVSNGLQIGTSTSGISAMNRGTCFVASYATTITASSTALVDCQATAGVSAAGVLGALTGVKTGDSVNVTFATSTTWGGNVPGLVITGAFASTTNGFISLIFANQTGTTYTWPTTGTASGSVYYITSR